MSTEVVPDEMDGLSGKCFQDPALKKCEDGFPALAPDRFPDPASEMGSKGHQQLDRAVRQLLEHRHRARLEAEQSRLREIERQRIQAEADRQTREQAKRIEQLKDWAKARAEAEQLCAFLSAWEKRTEGDQGAIESGSQADGFRRWVALVIDEFDPLIWT